MTISPAGYRARCARALLYDLTLEFEHSGRQFIVLRFEQKCIKATAMVDGLQGIGRYAQADPAAKRVGNQRDVAQVRQEPALGLDVGVAHFVADQWLFTGQVATP